MVNLRNHPVGKDSFIFLLELCTCLVRIIIVFWTGFEWIRFSRGVFLFSIHRWEWIRMQAVHLTAELLKSRQTKKYIWATELLIHKYKSCELWMDVFDSLKNIINQK